MLGCVCREHPPPYLPQEGLKRPFRGTGNKRPRDTASSSRPLPHHRHGLEGAGVSPNQGDLRRTPFLKCSEQQLVNKTPLHRPEPPGAPGSHGVCLVQRPLFILGAHVHESHRKRDTPQDTW